MVFIESNEILLSSALAGRLATDYPGIPIQPLRGGRPERNGGGQPERNGKAYPFVKCFLISEFPFNVYGIYEQIKAAARIAVAKDVPLDMYIVLKLGMEDVSKIDAIRKHCAQLYKLSRELPGRNAQAPTIHFSYAYNVFGAVRDAVIQPGTNSVQGLLFLLKNAERQIAVPFGKEQEVIGTDVEQAVSAVLENNNGREALIALPINTPVEAGTLVAALQRQYPGKYQLVQFLENPRMNASRVKEGLHAQTSDLSVTESFVNYLAT